MTTRDQPTDTESPKDISPSSSAAAPDPDLCGEGARTPFARAVGELVFPDMAESRRELFLRIAGDL